MFGVKSSITRFRIASSFFYLVIFRVIGSTLRDLTVNTKHTITLHSNSLNTCACDEALYMARRNDVFTKIATRMEISLVIRFNLRFTMKLTQTRSTVQGS